MAWRMQVTYLSIVQALRSAEAAAPFSLWPDAYRYGPFLNFLPVSAPADFSTISSGMMSTLPLQAFLTEATVFL